MRSLTLASPAGRLLEPRERRAGGRQHGRGPPRARHVPRLGVHPAAAERHGAQVSPQTRDLKDYLHFILNVERFNFFL